MKIKFDTDDNLSLNKQLKLPMLTKIAKSVFKDGKFFRNTIQMTLCMNYSTKKLMFQKELTLIKQGHLKNVCFVIIGTLKLLDLNSNCMFVTNVMMF